MPAEKEALKEMTVRDVLARKRRYSEAARELGVTVRTLHNYCRRFLEQGLEGLKDRRTGNHHKLNPLQRATIVAMKQERPQRSVRFIRDRLRLNVSEEAVRLILVKHSLNGYRKAS